jgi:hypothetical protein
VIEVNALVEIDYTGATVLAALALLAGASTFPSRGSTQARAEELAVGLFELAAGTSFPQRARGG